jgi:hypothetical protein
MNLASNKRKKFFTVDEANRTLPLVSAITQDIVDLFKDLHERRDRLTKVRQAPGADRRSDDDMYGEELEDVEREIEGDIQRLEGFVDELRELGVQLKDFVKGLVDFPHLMDGKEVCLCWMVGEDEVAHWHEPDAGFSGRQSLLEGSVFGGSDDCSDTHLAP